MIEIEDEKKCRVYWKDGTSFVANMTKTNIENMRDVVMVEKVEVLEE